MNTFRQICLGTLAHQGKEQVILLERNALGFSLSLMEDAANGTLLGHGQFERHVDEATCTAILDALDKGDHLSAYVSDTTGSGAVFLESPAGREKLPTYLDEVNHSPDGFAWGYGGSGPSQLAYAILRHHTGSPATAQTHYMAFKRDVIAAQDGENILRISVQRVRDFLQAIPSPDFAI